MKKRNIWLAVVLLCFAAGAGDAIAVAQTIDEDATQEIAAEAETENATNASDAAPVRTVEKVKFNITPSLGLVSGVVQEKVITSEKKTLSRLDWQQYAFPAGQAEGGLTWRNWFLQGKILAGIPMPCGIMDDFDFETHTTNPTKFSHHDMQLNWRFDVGGEIGYNFYLGKFLIAPSIGMMYRTHKWTASNGYRQYSSGILPQELTGNEPKVDMSGDMIDYTQSWGLPFFASQFVYVFADFWKAAVGCNIFPFLIVGAIDQHLVRSPPTQFYDTMRGGFGFAVNASVQFKKIVVKFEYEFLSVLQGTTKWGNTGESFSNLTEVTDGTYPGTTSSLFTIGVGWAF